MPAAPAHGGAMRIVLWNPLSLCQVWRQSELAHHFRGVQAIICPGTQLRASEAHEVRQATEDGFLGLHWGAGRGRWVNKSCGISMYFDATKFKPKNVARVYPVPAELQGRVAVVRMKSPWYDLVFVGAYMPPRPTAAAEQARYRTTVDKVLKFVGTVLSESRYRSTPVLGLDLNDGVGLQAAEWGYAAAAGPSVGGRNLQPEGYAGQNFRELMEVHHMAVVVTHEVSGVEADEYTWQGPHEQRTLIEYLCVPIAMLPLVKSYTRMDRANRMLRMAPRVPDHFPVHLDVRYQLRSPDTKPYDGWNQDLLTLGVREGYHREDFVRLVEARLKENDNYCAITDEGGNPDDAYEALVAVIRESARDYFGGRQTMKTAEYAELARLRTECVRRRRQLRSSAGGEATATQLDEVGQRLKELTKECRRQRDRWNKAQQRSREALLNEALRRGRMQEAFRLTRLLARTGVGPKRRWYGGARQHMTREEVLAGLGAPAHEGGMQAVEFDYESHRAEYIRERPQPPLMSAEQRAAAAEMVDEMVWPLMRAARRRVPPPWGLPTELWMMLLRPNRNRRVPAAGVGYVQGRLSTPTFYACLKAVFAQILRWTEAPLCWQRSMIATLGLAKVRYIHLLDPMGTIWYRTLYLAGGRFQPHYADHGFVARRRREAAILIQQCVSWRLRRQGRSSFKMLFDMTNAFASTPREQHERIFAGRAAAPLYRQRYERSYMRAETSNGPVDLLGTVGGRMGDKNEPEAFAEVFREPIAAWNTAQTLPDRERLLIARCPVTNRRVDLSLTKYADDVAKEVVMPEEAIERDGHYDTMREMARECNESLDEYLACYGYSQNRSKQAIIPNFVGVGSNRGLRAALAGDMDGRVEAESRYLGPYLHYRQATGGERRRRIVAARKGYASMGRFWSSRAPAKVKRMAYFARVLGPLLSGCEALVLTATDVKLMDVVALRLLRGLARAKACGLKVMEDGTKAYKALSAAEMRRAFRIADVATELRVRRLKWLQGVVLDPDGQCQLIAALFAQLPGEPEATLTEDGLGDDANPWARQLDRDLRALAAEDDGEVVREVAPDWRELFAPQAAERFAHIDVSCIRARVWSRSVPPEGAAEADESQPLLESGDDDCEAFACRETGCAARFRSQRALVAHVRFAHGYRNPTDHMVVSRTCFWCSSVFSSVAGAKHHVDRAFRSGACSLDRSQLGVTDELEGEVACPAGCGQTFVALSELNWHIRSRHAPEPPPALLWSASVHGPADAGGGGQRIDEARGGRWRRRGIAQPQGASGQGRRRPAAGRVGGEVEPGRRQGGRRQRREGTGTRQAEEEGDEGQPPGHRGRRAGAGGARAALEVDSQQRPGGQGPFFGHDHDMVGPHRQPRHRQDEGADAGLQRGGAGVEAGSRGERGGGRDEGHGAGGSRAAALAGGTRLLLGSAGDGDQPGGHREGHEGGRGFRAHELGRDEPRRPLLPDATHPKGGVHDTAVHDQRPDGGGLPLSRPERGARGDAARRPAPRDWSRAAARQDPRPRAGGEGVGVSRDPAALREQVRRLWGAGLADAVVSLLCGARPGSDSSRGAGSQSGARPGASAGARTVQRSAGQDGSL